MTGGRACAAASLTVLAVGCSTPATPTALSSSFADTFAGLYVGQQAQLGRPGLTRDALHVQSTCSRRGRAQQGPGEDWVCLVRYVDADATASQSFEVQMKPDGCWRAEGPPAVQPPTLADATTGRTSTNQLAEFDGCLDTSWG